MRDTGCRVQDAGGLRELRRRRGDEARPLQRYYGELRVGWQEAPAREAVHGSRRGLHGTAEPRREGNQASQTMDALA
jgi:hypothetical protein